MKKLLLSLATALCLVSPAAAQEAADGQKHVSEKLPVLIVFPSDDWCKRNGCVDADGSPDYTKAFENTDMLGAITAMGGIMADRNFEVKSLEAELRQLGTNDAVRSTLTAKGEDGTVLKESDLDLIMRTVKPDVRIDLSLDAQPYGPRTMYTFRIQSVDASSNDIIQGQVGNSSPSNAPMPVLLNEAVGNFIDGFCAQIAQHIAKNRKLGRKCQYQFYLSDGTPVNFEDEVEVPGAGEGELADFISYWFEENTVNGAYNQVTKTRSELKYNDVRIPMFGERKTGFGKGKVSALDAEGFIKGLAQPLKSIGLTMSTTPMGLGMVYVVLGPQY